jgi:hypothetical protein
MRMARGSQAFPFARGAFNGSLRCSFVAGVLVFLSACHSRDVATAKSKDTSTSGCPQAGAFQVEQIPDSLSKKYRLPPEKYLGSLPFHKADFWEIETKFDLNKDGIEEVFLNDGMPVSWYGTERAIISPCGESLFVLIYGPARALELFHTDQKLPKNLAYYVKNLDSLGASANSWIPLIEINQEIYGEECFDWTVARLVWKDGKYQPADHFKCDCQTDKCLREPAAD